MAHLVAPLVVGISGAANGTAEFYTAGTAVLSTQVFSDSEGETAVTTTTLDANGAAVRYLQERCDVVVKSSQGATVRQWTEGTHAKMVRVENALFTGPNAAGQTVASGRTTLHGGLTLFQESLGDEDGYVNINGVSYLLKNILGASGAVYFNVKTGYGAVGDNVNDDTSAIQSAINAAQTVSGGIVYFPPGTYKITGSLSVTSGSITLLGAGAPTAIIRQHTSGLANGWVRLATSFVTMQGLQIDSTAAGTAGENLEITSASVANTIINCSFTAGTGACLKLGASTGNIAATFTGCKFNVTNTAGYFAGTAATTAEHVNFVGCGFSCTVVATNALVKLTRSYFSNCAFFVSTTSPNVTFFSSTGFASHVTINACSISSSNTSGTNTLFQSVSAVATGCEIAIATGGTLQLAGTSATSFAESGSILNALGTISICSNNTPAISASTVRDKRRLGTTLNGTSYTVDANNYGIHEVQHSSGASMAFANPSFMLGARGGPLTILYRNATGGPLTPTWGTNFSGVPASAVANNEAALYEFRQGVTSAGVAEWVCVTTAPVVAVT